MKVKHTSVSKKLPFIKFRTAPATVKLAFPTPIYIKGL